LHGCTGDLTTQDNKRIRSPGHTAKYAAAVAVSYASDGDNGASKVVASERGWFIEKIFKIVFANDVKVPEDADLAEMLATVDLDSEIPVEVFIAVTEILCYVYAANGTTPPEVNR
jgi:flagellar biosynthesis protein